MDMINGRKSAQAVIFFLTYMVNVTGNYLQK
jgi:hypothetical protein